MAEYLRIPNWEKYQPKLKNGRPNRQWVRLDCNLEDDHAYDQLSDNQKMLWPHILRLCGRTGKNIPYDAGYIRRALGYRQCTTRVVLGWVDGLLRAGLLVLTNQQNIEEFAPRDKTRQDRTGQKKKERRPRAPIAPKSPVIDSVPFSDVAIRLFEEEFETKPVWDGSHYVQLRNLLNLNRALTVAEFSRRYEIFIHSGESFHQQQGGSLRYFCSNFDKFIKPLGGNGNGKRKFDQSSTKSAFAQALTRAEERDRQEALRFSGGNR